MRFENKVVLITGGTQGIGFATARLFAAEGAQVVIVGRDEDKTTEAARDVPAEARLEMFRLQQTVSASSPGP